MAQKIEKSRHSDCPDRTMVGDWHHSSNGRRQRMGGSNIFRLKLKHVLLATLIMTGALLGPTSQSKDCGLRAISGIVLDDSGKVVNDAVIRVRATKVATRSDTSGRFRLNDFMVSGTTRLTAWKDGYYVAGTDVGPGDSLAELVLTRYSTRDSEQYTWISPAVQTRSCVEEFLVQAGLDLAANVSLEGLFSPLARRLTLGCRDCHREVFDEWIGSAHALGAKNVRFLTMYNGTDMAGNQSPQTQYSYRGSCRILEDYGLIGQHIGVGRPSQQVQVYRRNYGAPLRPDPNRPYYGPGYKLDFPQTDGNCAACHLPSAAIEDPYGVDPNQVIGKNAQGSHCDLCHKIAAVKFDSITGLPYENMPGILSVKFARPGPDSQLFFGPYDDVDLGSHTYLPLMKESYICAPCHQASFWGVPVYESFAEWLTSPYPAMGKTCQSCHMKPNGSMSNFAPGRGGLERDPKTVPTHRFTTTLDEKLLQNALTMDVSADRRNRQVVVRVTIANDKTGHHVPTGSPLRYLILLVEAAGPEQVPLVHMDGPTLPNWCGVGDRAQGCYAGLPGKAYAKVLQEWWTELAPTGAYWNKTRILSDNRIAAFAADTSLFIFDAADHEEVVVNVKLLYRRAFVSLMRQKGWDDPDIAMGQEYLTVKQPHSLYASREENLK